HLDTLLGTVSALDRLFEDRLEVALCALAILREDEDTPMVPCGKGALYLLSDGRQVGAKVLADPVDQPSDLSVGQVARFLGSRLHLVEECLFAAPELLCVCISRRVALCGGSDTLDLGLLLGLKLFRRPLT